MSSPLAAPLPWDLVASVSARDFAPNMIALLNERLTHEPLPVTTSGDGQAGTTIRHHARMARHGCGLIQWLA